MRWLSTRTKAVLLALAIFAIGMVCGAIADRHVLTGHYRAFSSGWRGRDRKPPLEVKNRILARYERELDLSPDQKAKLMEILEESRRSMGEIRRGVRGEMDAVARDTRSRIRDLLTPAQQEKFDKLGERLRGRRPRPPHGP
jgi:Spy/CpxP family protein refolding chaperone